MESFILVGRNAFFLLRKSFHGPQNIMNLHYMNISFANVYVIADTVLCVKI